MVKQEKKLMDIIYEFSIPLIAGVVIAIIWANVNFESYTEFLKWSPGGLKVLGHPLNFYFLMNDIFMAFFFGIAAKEITESCLPGGSLNPITKAINPMFGTLGGIFGPIGIYFLFMFLTGSHEANDQFYKGWAIPTATDIALAWLVARIAFGNRHPAIAFLLLLAIADDAIGLGIIAIFYPNPEYPVNPIFLLIVLCGMLVCLIFRKMGVQNFWLYILVGGTLSWLGLILAHLHPALALVPIVPFIPAISKNQGSHTSEHHHSDPLNNFEHTLKKPIDLGLLGFGLANAGVPLSTIGNATWAVLLALVVGKTIGIYLFSMIGHWLGFALPEGLNQKSLVLVGMTAGIGMTVSLFVAGVAFTDPNLQGAAKMGALMSCGIAIFVILFAKMFKIKKD